MDASFWRGRRVFLTGHTGFKGGWLSLWLQSLGADLTGYALAPNSEKNLFEIAGLSSGMASNIGDIRELSRLKEVMISAQPEIVIHMAAQALVRESYLSPLETYEVNVLGTANVLEAVRNTSSVKAVINVTTDKCYENREWFWGYRETDHLGGYDPYSSSKACSELVTSAYRSSFFNPSTYFQHGVAIASARAGNVIGGGDWSADRLVPDILAAIARRESVLIRSPRAIRPWQHVLEPLSGYLLLAEKLASDEGSKFGEAWNFGPADEDARSVQWIVEYLIKYWGNDAGWRHDEFSHPHEATYLKLDCSKARMRLNWKPRWSLEHGLSAIIDWQRAFIDGVDMRSKTLAQISEFESKIYE